MAGIGVRHHLYVFRNTDAKMLKREYRRRE